MDHLQIGDPECGGVARNARGTLGSPFDRNGAQRHIRQQPFDCDRATSGSDVPKVLITSGRQCGKRQRADLVFGDLPVMLEEIVRKPRCPVQNARARGSFDFNCECVEGVDVGAIEVAGAGGSDALRGATQSLQDCDTRRSESQLTQ